MPNYAKLAKTLTSAIKQDVLPAAEREANLAKFLEQSKTPMRLYHGTTATEAGKGAEAISRLKPSKEGSLGSGVYMTPKPEFAGQYASTAGGNVLPVHAQLRNPLIIEGKHGDPMIEALMKLGMDENKASKMVERAYENKGYIGKEVENRARAAGYDGLMQYRNGELGEVVSYNPNAVKSAIGNKGTYDVYNPELNKASGGVIKMGAGGLLKAAKAALKVKPPSDNIAKVIDANFLFPKEIGNQTVKLNNLSGGVRMTDPHESKRVKELAQKISSPEGYISRIIVDHNNNVIEGQHRLEALRQLGIDDVPVYKIEDLSETMPITKMEAAVNSIGGIHPDNTYQLVRNALEHISEGGIDSARQMKYGKWQKHYDAALEAAMREAPPGLAQGGAVRMKGGGKAAAVTGGLKAIKELLSDEPLITAAQRAEAGRKAAELIKAQEQIKASEALGQLMEKGVKRTTTTQADRTRVGGGNIGGAAFPSISAADPNYAGKVWGVMDEGTAARLKNLTDPETAWTTMLGSATQLKTNPIVFDKLKRGFISSMNEGKLSEDLAKKINHNLALTFGEGADIRDPKIWRQADTFEKRAALADVMMGQGIAPGKGGVAIGGEKSGKGVIFKPTDILKRETEPTLLHSEHGGDVPTFAAGPRLFKMEKESTYRPDLHPGFPTLIKGEDYGYNVKPTPTEVYLPDWHKRFKEKNPERKGPGYYDLALGVKGEGLPSQELSDAYIRHLLREGFKEGGEVEGGSFADRLKSALEQHMAEGGEVSDEQAALAKSESFADRLKSSLEQHMAAGGEVSDNTTPDMTDGGNVNYGGQYADGGSAEGAPSAARQMFNKAIAMGKDALEAEYNLLKDPATRADILKRIALTTAGSGPDLLNLLASGVDLVQEQIPGLRKKVPESVMSEAMPMAYKRPSSYAPKFPLASEEMPGGAEHQIRNAKEAGLLGEATAPITEAVASIAGPFALGAAAKAAKAVPGAAKKIVNEMVTPISPRKAQAGAIGWHGTPHKFPPTEKNPLGEFDPTKIGSGEGAQAYGYGHYTAEAPNVAKEYAETLANRNMANQGRLNAHANAQRLANLAGDPKYAADDIKFALETNPDHPQKSLLQETLGLLESGKYAEPLQSKGTLYKIDIPDEQVAKMLDWDKPLKEQDIFKSGLLKEIAQDLDLPVNYSKAALLESKTGEDLNNALSQALGSPKKAAEYLQSWGIPGVKYLDANSRNFVPPHIKKTNKGFELFWGNDPRPVDVFKSESDAINAAREFDTRTRNFVVFPGNESMMNIVERHKRGGLAQAKG